MNIERPNAPQPSPDELQNLDKLKAIIERAIADGVLTRDERDSISAALYADRKVTPQELDLVRTLIREKITSGELTLDYKHP